jgi:O-acetyl-ADP-ribose deacetylase (regulator of RNase III)
MPIIFITLSETFANLAQEHGYDSRVQPIQDYQPRPTARRTYYVSPANSLCFMDGGIDLALSRQVFPGIEPIVKRRVRELGRQTLLGRPYLPIGSSLIIDDPNQSVSAPTSHTIAKKSLVVAPTMLLPQPVPQTRNAYYATMAVLYNILINRLENLDDVDILLTSFCCGYGRMREEESLNQILDGIRDYPTYQPKCISDSVILAELNLADQPKYYQNTEWMDIPPSEIQKC